MDYFKECLQNCNHNRILQVFSNQREILPRVIKISYKRKKIVQNYFCYQMKNTKNYNTRVPLPLKITKRWIWINLQVFKKHFVRINKLALSIILERIGLVFSNLINLLSMKHFSQQRKAQLLREVGIVVKKKLHLRALFCRMKLLK